MSCPTWGDNYGSHSGHGRAFMLISGKLEKAMTRLCGYEGRLGRYVSMHYEIQRSGLVVSACDVRVFGFGDGDSCWSNH